MTRWLPAIPMLLVPVALMIFAKGEPKVEPIAWAGALTAVVFMVWTALFQGKPRWWDALIVIGVALGAGSLFFEEGFPRGHDITTHLWGVWAFFKAILDGDWYPRWLHHLGLGMPLIQFYPPLPFFLMTPFLALDLAPYEALKFGFILYSALAGMSMYWVVARNTGHRGGALVAALAYAWSPYMLMDSHYRNALAESSAFIFAPLFFEFGIHALRFPTRRNVAKGALAAALLILSHPLSASMCCTGMAVWITLEWSPIRVGFKGWIRKLSAYALVGVAALFLAGFYTIPLAAEAKYASIGSAMGGKKPMFTRYGLRPVQLLEPRRWTAWQKAEPTGSEKDKKGQEMPYYLGLALVAAVPLAMARREEDEGKSTSEQAAEKGESGENSPHQPAQIPWKRVVAGPVALAITGFLCTLRPLDSVLGWIPNFSMLQFPFRFMFLATLGAAWSAGFATVNLSRMVKNLPQGPILVRLVPGLLGLLFVVDGLPYTGAASWNQGYDGVADQVYQRKGCDAELDCWAPKNITSEVPFRAEGTFFFPPADYDIELSLFKRVYPEYRTPEVRKAFYSKAKGKTLDGVLKELGVGWSFSGRGPKPRAIKNIKPYAEFKEGKKSTALEFTRKAGVITVKLPKRAGQVIVKEQYFPGWMLDNKYGRQDVNPTDTGLLQARVGAEQEELVFYFWDYRGDRVGGIAASVLTFGLLFWPARRRRDDDSDGPTAASTSLDGRDGVADAKPSDSEGEQPSEAGDN